MQTFRANQPTNTMSGVAAFIKFFTQIGPAFPSKLLKLVYVLTIPKTTETKVLNNTTTEEIIKISRSLKNEKSTGYDGILKCLNAVHQS